MEPGATRVLRSALVIHKFADFQKQLEDTQHGIVVGEEYVVFHWVEPGEEVGDPIQVGGFHRLGRGGGREARGWSEGASTIQSVGWWLARKTGERLGKGPRRLEGIDRGVVIEIGVRIRGGDVVRCLFDDAGY